MAQHSAHLKRFLRTNLYRHPQVTDTTDRAKQVIRDLFDAYCADPVQMPPEHAQRARRQRGVADYIAGMTDRFALREHERSDRPAAVLLSRASHFGVSTSWHVSPVCRPLATFT